MEQCIGGTIFFEAVIKVTGLCAEKMLLWLSRYQYNLPHPYNCVTSPSSHKRREAVEDFSY